MNLGAKFILSIGLLGLLCLTMPGAVRADDFTFTFTNTIGEISGTVTGEIYGLTDGSTGPATQVTLTSYPAVFDNTVLNPTDNPISLIGASGWTVLDNTFIESGNTIVGTATPAAFEVENPSITTGNDFALTDELVSGEVIGLLGNTGDGDYVAGVVTFTPVTAPVITPEPGTTALTLTGLGLLGLLVAMRKRYDHRFPQAV
jgi:hypothetical protein